MGEGWIGADDFFRIEVTPTDTGRITFTKTPIPPDETIALSADSTGAGVEIEVQWDANTIVVDPCPSEMMGDVNQDAQVSSADIIYLVNYVFRGGPLPLPVALAGDADCSRHITSADMIWLADYVFRGGPDPCPCIVPGP